MKTLTQIIIAVIIMLTGFTVLAEEKTMEVESSHFFLSGTTNIGSWDCTQWHAEGTIKVNPSIDGYRITSLNVQIPVKEFTDCTPPAGPSSGQEKAVHKHLKAEEHPYVTFELVRTQPGTILSEDSVMFYGSLTAAGVSQTIRAKVSVERNTNTIKVSGIQDLKMTDFEIDPPTGLFGAIRAREEVEVEYEITFE